LFNDGTEIIKGKVMTKFFRMILLTAIFTYINIPAQFGRTDLVDLTTYTSFSAAHPGSEMKLAVRLNIEEGWHINSENPKDEFLIGTQLTFDQAALQNAGLSMNKINFPPFKELKFAFSDQPVTVFEGEIFLTAIIKVDAAAAEGLKEVPFTLTYQACNDASCMPPVDIQDTLRVEIVSKTNSVSEINQDIFADLNIEYTAAPQESEGDSLAKKLEESGLILSLLFVFLGGLALNLTPCVYPLIPITVGYFGGQSEGSTGRLFMLGVFYVLGISVTYSIIGVVTSLSGAVFGALLQNPLVIIFVALVLLVLALSMFGLYDIKMPDAWVMKAGGARSGVAGALFMGLTMGIVAAPCIGPFVLGLVTYVAAKADPFYGFMMFFFLALGLGTPYLFLALFSGKIKKLPRAGFWMDAVKHIFGFILVGMAVYFILPLLPKPFSEYLLPVYAAGAALYLLFFDKLANNVKGFRIFKIVFSVIILAVSVYFIIPTEKKSPEWESFSFSKYENAIASNEKIMLDFYADWCIPCKELDAMTFSDPRVIELSRDFVPMKVDLTKSTSDASEEVRKKFEIRGVPTVILIDSNGKEISRITGFLNAEEFLKLMKAVN